jgi:polysaccharide biosynthesis/export protein
LHFSRKIVVTLILLLSAAIIAGCTSSAIDTSTPADGKFINTGTQEGIGGAAAAGAQKVFTDNSASSTPDKSDYKIAALDVVEVSVFGVADLTRTAQVSSSGMITLPLIKSVKAAGKTTGQLEQEIASKLQTTYLQSPQVSVLVKEFNSQKITVDGAVKKPGIFPISGSVSMLQAVALAEGLNEVADPTGILLFRTIGDKRMAARFDLRLIRGGKVQDPMLKAGDIVMVDENSRKTTLREVKDALPLSGLFQLLLL